ncbi:MAG TPA: GAF domain-containing protein [Anaerolineales bacterium]|nr:GAF domain-containing protein [Anaerolineales bacterium]
MIRQYFSPPHFESEDDNFRAKFIYSFGLIALGLLLIGIVPFLFQDRFNFTVIVLAGLIGVMILSLYLLRKGHLNLSGIILVVLTWAGITIQAYTADGVKDVIVVGYIAVSLLAGIVNWRAGTIVLLVSIAAIWMLTVLELNGLIVPSLEETTGYARDLSIIFIAIAAMIYFSTTSLRDAVRRANRSEQALRASNESLQNLNQTLEERVASRTLELESAYQRNERRAKQFEAIAEVTRATTANQNLETLLSSLTQVISEQFDFYHTGIFLLDENREYAVLKAANSTGGNRMLQHGHKLRVGHTGIVGMVAAIGTPRIALDVGLDAAFFDNPDLPNTRSEVALPLHAAGEIIGVLDVQSTEENAFQAEDREVLTTLADQVMIAIQNAHSYEITQELLTQAERTSGFYLRDSWKLLQAQDTRVGYIVSGNTVRPLNKTLSSPQIEQVITCREAVVESGKNPVLAVPIQLRNEVVGVMDIHMPEEHEWDPDEIDIVQAVAERLSLAIETSLLIESTRRQAEMERVTSEISAKISSTTQFDSILRTAAEELSRVLGGSEVYVQLQPDALERPQAGQASVLE